MFRLIRLFLPVIFPSWRFFRAVEPSPRIEVLRGGVWVEALARPGRLPIWRQLGRLFWNPGWNRYLYSVSLSERMVVEPSDHSLAGLVEILSAGMAPGEALRFRILFVQELGGEIIADLEYECPEIIVEASR